MDNYTRVSKNLVTLPAVRRGDYLIKVSVFNGQILLVATHAIELDKIHVRSFWDSAEAYKFIDMIIEKG